MTGRLGVVQKTATALNSEVRLAANPASLDYLPVAGSIEDHATMAVESVGKAGRAVAAAFALFAVELLVAAPGDRPPGPATTRRRNRGCVREAP
jgi:histidine ammonia-lyase